MSQVLMCWRGLQGGLRTPCPEAHALGRLTAALLMKTTMSMDTSARTSMPSCSSEGRW